MPGGEQELFRTVAITSFRLNGQFFAIAEKPAAPAGLTAAWWQMLGSARREPLPVAGIARAMGITRQSVQRIADLLVDKGLTEYRPNPAHRRAKLVAVTEKGARPWPASARNTRRSPHDYRTNWARSASPRRAFRPSRRRQA